MNIIITGASKGLGKSIAEEFAATGAHTILLCARGKNLLEETSRELQQRYPQTTIKFFACDLSIKAEISSFSKWILNEVDAIDLLVNNAGSFLPGSVQTEEDGTLEKMMEANLYTAYYLTRLLLPFMIKKKSGHIFNMCSIASLKAYSNGGAYSISKFALLGFTKNLREEMKLHNIKVTAVIPGAAYTDSWASSGINPGRIMEAKDIAKMICASAALSPQACVEDIIIRPQLGDL